MYVGLGFLAIFIHRLKLSHFLKTESVLTSHFYTGHTHVATVGPR